MIRCDGSHSIHDAVVMYVGTFYVTSGSRVSDIQGSPCSSGTRCNDTLFVHCRLPGGSSDVDIPGQWQCNVCSASRCWPVAYVLSVWRPDSPPTPAPWTGKNKGS